MTSPVQLKTGAMHAAQRIMQGFHIRRRLAAWEQRVLRAVPARRWRAKQHAACATRCTPARLPIPARGCRIEEVESERADRLREGSSGGVPFPPGLTWRFSAYITCKQGHALSAEHKASCYPPPRPQPAENTAMRIALQGLSQSLVWGRTSAKHLDKQHLTGLRLPFMQKLMRGTDTPVGLAMQPVHCSPLTAKAHGGSMLE